MVRDYICLAAAMGSPAIEFFMVIVLASLATAMALTEGETLTPLKYHTLPVIKDQQADRLITQPA